MGSRRRIWKGRRREWETVVRTERVVFSAGAK
jgi:hypothetical protein